MLGQVEQHVQVEQHCGAQVYITLALIGSDILSRCMHYYAVCIMHCISVVLLLPRTNSADQHCTLYAVHCRLYVVRCTLYAVHCTCQFGKEKCARKQKTWRREASVRQQRIRRNRSVTLMESHDVAMKLGLPCNSAARPAGCHDVAYIVYMRVRLGP